MTETPGPKVNVTCLHAGCLPLTSPKQLPENGPKTVMGPSDITTHNIVQEGSYLFQPEPHSTR